MLVVLWVHDDDRARVRSAHQVKVIQVVWQPLSCHDVEAGLCANGVRHRIQLLLGLICQNYNRRARAALFLRLGPLHAGSRR